LSLENSKIICFKTLEECINPNEKGETGIYEKVIKIKNFLEKFDFL
jgi:hypothetical protein